MNNPVQKLIDIVGSQSELARRCQVKQQSVFKWLKKGVIPTGRVPAAIQACKGKMSPEELCPAAGEILKLATKQNISSKP